MSAMIAELNGGRRRMSDLAQFEKLEPEETKANGCHLWRRGPFPMGDRYAFDFNFCKAENGWQQYDTEQDFHGFGVWVHLERRLIVTYAEGDVTVVYAPTRAALVAELAEAAKFYGEPPPAWTVIDQDGAVTRYYDKRPTGQEVTE